MQKYLKYYNLSNMSMEVNLTVFSYSQETGTFKKCQCTLTKVHFDAGLKQLAKSSGYPLAAIQGSSQFKCTHAFIIEAWKAFYRVLQEK